MRQRLDRNCAFELRVLVFVDDAPRVRDQFIIIFTVGRPAAFAKFSENFVPLFGIP